MSALSIFCRSSFNQSQNFASRSGTFCHDMYDRPPKPALTFSSRKSPLAAEKFPEMVLYSEPVFFITNDDSSHNNLIEKSNPV